MTKAKSGNKKLWGGRFEKATSEQVETFTESVSFDARLYAEDIAGSIAHSKMLNKIGVLTDGEAAQIEQGLTAIGDQIERGEFEWSAELEDVHMNIEARLTDAIGEAGKKLHTGRSRNDQVATDMRLHLRNACDRVDQLIRAVQAQLLTRAEAEVETIMPGYTHMQVAQPVSLAHHLLAWFEMLERDADRFADARRRINVMPLGSAALAGTSFPIDREMTCQLLGFSSPSRNSLDAVSDRDFLIEFASASSLLMIHLSRICEEIVLWASDAYRFIEIEDEFCTGSSIMPQKKNPDVAELIRGKSARSIGNLQSLLVLMKAQPLAYNRDNQEDKQPVFDSIDVVESSLQMLAGMLPGIRFDGERMYRAAQSGHATATDLAEYLVGRGVAFRTAHEIVGNVVQYAIQRDRQLSDLNLQELQSFGDMIDKDVYDVLTLEGSLHARDHIGGTAPKQVRAALVAARKRLS